MHNIISQNPVEVAKNLICRGSLEGANSCRVRSLLVCYVVKSTICFDHIRTSYTKQSLYTTWLLTQSKKPRSAVNMDNFSIYLWLYSPFVGPWPIFQVLNPIELLGRGISTLKSRYLHTQRHKHRVNPHTDIHDLSGIRNHDPSVRAGEDSWCLRPSGHCDPRKYGLPVEKENKLQNNFNENCFEQVLG
jgi:hypothetical protein